MEANMFGRIYDHYFATGTMRVNVRDMRKAYRTFFGRNGDLDPGGDSHFNEWLMFEHPLSSGDGRKETLLARWIRENPSNVGSMTMRRYRALHEDNRYGWFEVVAVRRDSGMTLRAVADGTVYDVVERNATHTAERGMFMIARVGRIGDHYELVSAGAEAVPPLSRKARAQFMATVKERPWTVRDTYRFLHMKDPPGPTDADMTAHDDELLADDAEEIEREATALFVRLRIDTQITVKQVRVWIEQAYFAADNRTSETVLDEVFNTPATLLMGLAQEIASDEDMDAVFETYTALLALAGIERRSGETPYERERMRGKEYAPDEHVKVSGAAFDWVKHAEAGTAYLKKHDAVRACVAYDAAFEHLLLHRTTTASVYRLFANAGTAHFLAGRRALGTRLVEYARALNPLYGFAHEQLRHIAHEPPTHTLPKELRGLITGVKRGRGGVLDEVREKIGMPVSEAYMKKQLAVSPAHRYYEWLTPWGISFERDEPFVQPKHTPSRKRTPAKKRTRAAPRRTNKPALS